MSLRLDEFQLEYVTGMVTLPPVGESPRAVWPLIAVTNAGRTAAHTRTLVYRTRASEIGQDPGFDQVLDSDVDNAQYGQALPNLVPPGKTWVWSMDEWDKAGTFWFSIRATSPSLVPSIEFRDTEGGPDSSAQLPSMALRYVPGDFAVFHHQLRVLPPVLVPGGLMQGQ